MGILILHPMKKCIENYVKLMYKCVNLNGEYQFFLNNTTSFDQSLGTVRYRRHKSFSCYCGTWNVCLLSVSIMFSLCFSPCTKLWLPNVRVRVWTVIDMYKQCGQLLTISHEIVCLLQTYRIYEYGIYRSAIMAVSFSPELKTK